MAVEAVLIQIVRMPVRCCHNGDACANKARKQARHDCGVGHVIHDHFVKAEQACLFRQRFHQRRNRIAQLFGPLHLETRMNIQHELMKMNALFSPDLNRVEKQIHQHRFAAPDPAP